jgi:gliding motility-associated-like protein
LKKVLLLILLFVIDCTISMAQSRALFNANPNTGCTPATIKFLNQSTGIGLTYFWDLGNGNFSSLKDPKAIYYAPGFYTIKLVITDNKGNKDSIIRKNYVEVFKNPVANFEAVNTNGCTPFDPKLTDKSTRGSGMITSWIWDYGNGKVITEQKPTYNYTDAGIYSISLLIKDANGCQSDTIRNNYITANASVKVLFVADKTISCQTPLTVNFTNKSIGLKSGETYLWDFDDGSTSTSSNPKNIFKDTGSYDISLTVKSSNGCISSEKIPNYITISKPKPSFNYYPTEVCENGDVNFVGTSKPLNFNLVHYWDFGDGNSGQGNNVSHKYKKTGNYTVTLTVKLPDGSCSETFTINNAVKVIDKPITDFSISDTLFCRPGYFDTFIDHTKSIANRFWYIGDSGFISSNKGIILKIEDPGYTSVSLVTFNGSCYDTLTRQVYKDSIVPFFDLDPKVGCKPLKVNFSDLSTSRIPITSWFWDLGDGNFQNQPNFDHTYMNSGKYTVKLTVTTEQECSFSYVDTVYVGDKPNIEFDFSKTSKCNGTLLEINTAKNKNNLKIDKWKWFLDTTLISRQKELSYKLHETPDTYNIKLVASNSGCNDTFILKNILTVLPPKVSYIITFDSCKGFPYTFRNQSIQADEIGWVFKDTFILNKDTLIVRKNDPWPIKMWGKNFTSGCVDTVKQIDPILEEHLVNFSYSGNLCAPASLTFINTSIDYENFIWKWGNQKPDKNQNNTIKKTFDIPGIYTIRLSGTTSDGCYDSAQTSFEVKGPEVNCEVFPKSGCGPLKITLINRTKNVTTNKKYWKISGLAPIPVTSDTMYYTLLQPGPLEGGKYSVGLNIEDNSGCVGLSSDTVQVNGIPFNFKVWSVATCDYPKLSINPSFKESNIDLKSLNYAWDIGDGRTFNTSSIDFMYQSSSTFRLSLKIIDHKACITEKDTFIVIKSKTLEANLLADKLDANCPPLAVNFISKSKDNFGTIVSYFWDFGDGSYSNLKDPSHIYLVAGKFTIKHAVKDDIGCLDTIVYKDLILINGPLGQFKFDKKIGCTPLLVNFSANISNTKKLEWDMGDGAIIEDSLKAGHTYTRIGNYIPLLVLADSFGCKYTLPPIDTIQVFPLPIPNFIFTSPCINQAIKFTNISNPLKGRIKRSEWDFGDGDTSSQFEPIHVYKKSGTFKVKLKVWNSADCFDYVIKDVSVKNIKANYHLLKNYYCSGQAPTLQLNAQSDTSIKQLSWFLNDTFISKMSNPTLPKLSAGIYKIGLAIEDHFGCKDTLNSTNGIIIGDTFAPSNPFIYRVSVENDNQVVLDFSGYKSFDFKAYSIYEFSKKIASISKKNDTTLLISNLNTLHKTYCFQVSSTNLCQFESNVNLAPEHCTVETKAMGELRRIKLTWNAYTGWPVKTYDVFRENLSIKGKYDYLATVSGNSLSYIDTSVYCKVTHFYRIRANENNGFNQISWSDTTAAKPLFERSVPPNSTIRATVDFDSEVTIEWRGSGNPRIPISEYVLEKSEDGINYHWSKKFKPDEFSFTDKNVLVDNLSYFYRTYAIDTCASISPFTNFAKTILLKADTTPQERPFVFWSAYQGWLNGVSGYEVQRKKEDGTFITIGHTSNNDSLLIDNITDLNGYPYYCYRVIGYKNLINGEKQILSISNEDCAPVRSRIYAPNAFTINGDNLNETFDIKGLYIKDYNIKIFTRWGEKVFESNNMNNDWDGFYEGKLAQMDAYIWVIKAIGVDDVNWPLSGTVTIIR